MITNKIKLLFLLSSFNAIGSIKSQNIGLEFQAGPQFTFLNYNQQSLDYKSISNNDIRIGVAFGNFEKYTGSVLLSKSTIRSQYTDETITSNLEIGYTVIDVQFRYFISKGVQSISIGPTFLLRNYSSQTINNLVIRNNRMLSPTAIAINTDINFNGWDFSTGKLNPYIFFRGTINGIETMETDEKTNIYQFGLGVKMSLSWDI